jgi:Tfp pilus assembly protein PilN
MTAKLNLASNPFRNRAFPWTVTILIAVASIVALMFIAQSTIQTNGKVEAAQRDVSDLRKQADALNRHAKEIETALTPDQKRNLKSAHALVDRKRFSWTRLFADLEASLPGSIRVTRIAVKEIRIQDDRPVADLDLVVASKTPASVTEMIQDMESEGVFHAELVAQNPQRGKGEVGSEYELNVHYVPRAGIPLEPSEKSKRPVDTAGEGGRPQ